MMLSRPDPAKQPAQTQSGRGYRYWWAGLLAGIALLWLLAGCVSVVEIRPVTPTPEPTATPPPTPRPDVTPEDKRPRLRAVNASLRVPVADIYLGDRLYFRNIYFSNISNYVPVDGGKKDVRVRPTGVVDSPPISEREWEFKDDRDYTMLILSTPGGMDRPWVFEDNNKGVLLPGETRVRLVHASLDMPALQICVGEVCEILAYRETSDYLTIKQGTYSLVLRPAGNDAIEPVVLPVTFSAGEVYTVFVLDPEQGEIRPRIIPHLDTN